MAVGEEKFGGKAVGPGDVGALLVVAFEGGQEKASGVGSGIAGATKRRHTRDGLVKAAFAKGGICQGGIGHRHGSGCAGEGGGDGKGPVDIPR